ncbi:uncharacterized protein [Procambarus clarkii]|uniref:uncharacterized protein n=1 Tax=Procambarus clarkii TaxID=6728 RepID=UPI0037428C71
MKRKNFIILIVVAVMVTGSPAKSDTRPTGNPGGGAVVPHEGSKVGTEGRRSEVTLALHGVPVQVFIEVKGATGDGWLHLAAGDGTSETFLMSTPADLDLSEVTGSPSLTLHLREETESESEIVEGDIKHSSSSSDGREATRLVPVPHQKDDLQHFEHQGYHSSPPEHQGYHSSPPEHQINDLPLDKRQENSIPNIATIPILTSPLKCPTFTPLMSPNTDPDIKTSAYELNCKVTPEGRLYDVTHTFDTPGRYQLAAYYEERASGSTRWRQEMTVVVEELLQVVLGEC